MGNSLGLERTTSAMGVALATYYLLPSIPLLGAFTSFISDANEETVCGSLVVLGEPIT